MSFDFSNEDPFSLSRRLAGCVERVRRWERLRGGSDPFSGQLFPGQSTYDAVKELSRDDPLREPLLRAVHRLVEQRILVPYWEHDWFLQNHQEIPIEEPVEKLVVRAELREKILTSRGEQLRGWVRSWSRHEASLRDHRLQIFSAVSEVSERLGAGAPEVVFDPLLPDETQDGEKGGLRAVARQLLQQSNDAAQSCISPGWEPFVEALVAHEAAEGWPARLAPDNLRRLYGSSELFRGISLQPGPLPRRLVPLSFPRAAAKLGRALSAALAPAHLPFVVARDVDDLAGHASAEFFLAHSLSRSFLRRSLSLSGESLRRSDRALSTALLAHVRLAAARFLVADAAGRGAEAALECFGETSAQLLLGPELPPGAALARFSVRPDQAARFAGLLGAWVLYEEFVETYDEDFFASPRAQEQLRAELSNVAPKHISREVCARALEVFAKQWSERL